MTNLADNPTAAETARLSVQTQVRRTAWVALPVNIVLSALKFAGGILGNSQVLIADAVHSLSDSATDVALLIGVRFWSKPPDDEHPHGHQRIETLITVTIAVSLAAVAVGLMYNALTMLHKPHGGPPRWIAFVAAVISIAVKEALCRWTAGVGRRIRSSAVVANAWHHRSDALSSVPAALAVVAGVIDPSWSFLDEVAAVVVALLILHAAWRIGWPALGQLIDTGVSAKERERIEATAKSVQAVRDIHALRTRYIGSGIGVDLHVLVDAEMTVSAGHDVASEVKHRLLADGGHVVDVVVHVEPYEGPTGSGVRQ